MKRNKARITITCSIVIAGVAFAANASAAAASTACSRDMLQKLAATYVKAQTDGKPASIPLAANAYYGENDKAMEIGKGMLAAGLKVDFTRSFHDTTLCATFTELVGASDPNPYVILTRMEATRDGKVSKMESVVTHQGDWAFGATEYLGFTKAENWDEIPADKRDTREAIQKAAESYINHWGDPTLTVLHGTPCVRLEGRMYSSRDPAAQACNMPAFPRPLVTGHRRFVIDENYGAILIFHDFPFIDAGLPPEHVGTPAGQMFRVEGGKNRYIHEVTACTTPNCGRAARGAGGGGRGGGPGAGPGGPGRQGGPGGPGAPAGAPGAPPPAAPGAAPAPGGY